MTIFRTTMVTLALVTLVACATTQALHTDASASAIRSAEELGANSVPKAALHLQLAKEELKAAALLNAAFAFCLGCEVYLLLRRVTA